MVIVGLVVLLVGVASASIGVYLERMSISQSASGLNSKLTNTVTLEPSQSETIHTMNTTFGYIIYNDSLNDPLTIKVQPEPSSFEYRSVQAHGTTLYIGVLVNQANTPVTITLINNQTAPVTVDFGYGSASNLASLVAGGLAILLGIILFIVGLIVTIVGLVLKASTQ